VSATTCPRCHSINLASAVVCVNCGQRLGAVPTPGPPQPAAPPASSGPPQTAAETGIAAPPPQGVPGAGAPAPPLPPTPVTPVEGTWPDAVPPVRPRTRWFLPVLVIVALIVAGAVAIFLTRDASGGLPEEIDGLPRLHTAEAQALQDAVEGQEVEGLSISTAMYGDSVSPKLVVGVFAGLPPELRSAPMDGVFTVLATALTSQGGSLHPEEAVTATDGGTEYRCAPVDAPAGAGPPETGVLCMWRDDDIGIVLTFRTGDASAAVADARLAHDAVG
jgi:hypothetical protein